MMFGQGISVNAIQAAAVFQTIANDGVRVPPAARRRHARRPTAAYAADPGAQARCGSSRPTAAKQLREMLEGVVGTDGTAPEAKIPGYRVAGKTGTADRYDAEAGGYSRQARPASSASPRPTTRRSSSAVTCSGRSRRYFGGVRRRPGVQGRHDLRAAGAEDPADRHDAAEGHLKAHARGAGSRPTVLRDGRQRSAR